MHRTHRFISPPAVAALVLLWMAPPRAWSAATASFDSLRADYQAIASALAAEDAAKVLPLAARFVEDAGGVPTPRDGKEALQAAAAAGRTMTTPDLAALRESFKTLSKQLATVSDDSGKPMGAIYHCPMADAYWLQPESDRATANPYLGPTMAGCGSRVGKVED